MWKMINLVREGTEKEKLTPIMNDAEAGCTL